MQMGDVRCSSMWLYRVGFEWGEYTPGVATKYGVRFRADQLAVGAELMREKGVRVAGDMNAICSDGGDSRGCVG